jgi:penicillin-binding protein 1A
MPQSPSGYDPFENPDAAMRRRAEVLRAMRDDGAISDARYRAALLTPLRLRPPSESAANRRSYLTDWIASQLIDQYGAERVRRGGLRVYTTLDARLQREAEQAITKTLDRKGDPAGALVSADPKTGAIRAMAVAQTGHRLAFNIAALGRRQAGSTFKTFVLTEALQRGINPWATKYLSAPFLGPRNWHVQTYEHTYSGRIPLSEATVESDNTVFARLTLDMGPQRIATLARRMGVRTQLEPIPPIGLGAIPISPLDLADAYTTLAGNGVRHTPRLIERVVFPGNRTDRSGSGSSSRVLDGKVVAQVTKVLQANVQGGTGTAARLSDRQVAGKTGTTDSYADAWFAGYVPQLATVVWVGYPDRERPMRDVHGIQVLGGTFPAQIWHTFMTAALQGKPAEQFADPGAPPFHRWCGRYQFARTAADARPANRCAQKNLQPKSQTGTVPTSPAPATTATPTQTAPPPPTAPPPTTSQTPTTAPTTTAAPPGPNTEPDATKAVGKTGTVYQDVDADGNGIVQVQGKYYRAMNADDPSQTIPAGTQVDVVDASGDTAYVRPKQQPGP